MLPTNALYTRKKESQAGRRFRTAIQPQQGSGNYVAGNTITINIPTAPNQLLIPSESTFNFTFSGTNDSGAALTYLRLDSCGAHGFIQRIRVYHGSNLLEDIDNYGQLAKMLFDYQVPTDAAAGRHSVTTGTRSDAWCLPAIPEPTNNTAAQIRTSVNVLSPVRYSNTGALLAASIPNGDPLLSKTFSINLISLVGSLSAGKYLPLFAMSSAPLRIELQLVSNIHSACACDVTPTDWKLSNCEFIGEFLQLSDAAISMIMSGSDSPLQFTTPAFANYQYTAALANAATTQVNIPVPAKYSSLKGLITSIRNNAAGVNTAAYYPFSSHPFSLSQAYWRIGSSVVPSKPLASNEEYFNETIKVFGSIADQLYQPAIDLETYSMNTPVAATNGQQNGTGAGGANYGSGGFALGLDLEVYAGSERDAFFQGINTLNDDIFVTVSHSGGQGAVASCRYDTFALFDRVVVCENGVMSTRF